MPCISNFAELQVQLLKFSKVSFTEAEAEFFMKAILKYIDIIIKVSANRGYRRQIKICRKWFDVLPVSIPIFIILLVHSSICPYIF